VWDPDGFIRPESPFPDQIYFILSLPRFIDIFGTVDNIAEKMVWLPTWHQARLLCQKLGVSDEAVTSMLQNAEALTAGEDLIKIYELLIDTLQRNQKPT
jgi:hypothetical protein